MRGRLTRPKQLEYRCRDTGRSSAAHAWRDDETGSGTRRRWRGKGRPLVSSRDRFSVMLRRSCRQRFSFPVQAACSVRNVHRPGSAVSGILCWPLSITWLPAVAARSAHQYNYDEFRKKLVVLREEQRARWPGAAWLGRRGSGYRA